MTSIRVSMVYSPEDTFRGGKPSSKRWIAPPAGTYMSVTYDRAVTTVYSEGSKMYSTVAYGQVSGSFSWTFMADYEYIEPFYLAFDSYSCASAGNGLYTHTFSKANNSRIKSFCMRVKQLNRMAGGPKDEVTEFLGCIVQSVKFSASAGSSQVQVTFSGKFADARTWTGALSTTDFVDYNGDLWEFECLFMGTSPSNSTYVEMVDSLSVSIDNGADMTYSTCSPFAVNFYEGQAKFGLSVSCYSNDPDRLKLRAYTGGQSVATGSPVSPWSKNLAPCSDMVIYSYNVSAKDEGMDDIGEAITESDRTAMFHVEDCVYRVAQWPASDNSKLQEQISGSECKRITLTVKTDIPDLETTNSHPVDSPNPA